MKAQPRHIGRGFTLIELVFVLFITGLMLYLVAGLTSKTYQTMKFLQEKGNTLQSASLACERLATELREAIEVSSLSPLRFVKVRPSAPPGVGNLVSGDPGTWNRRYPSNQTSTIGYSEDTANQKVMRQVDSEPAQAVATNVNIFQVTPYEAGVAGGYRVELSILENRRVVTFITYVCCPGLAP
jgi:prepilin-type N-terminal cleavage/methylation domain-containing protein